MERTVVVTIDGKGKGFTVEAEGFQGQGCKAAVEAFESMGPVIRAQEKDEFYENPNHNTLELGR